MSGSASTIKGNRLELAVQTIERAILLSNPALAHAKVEIEPKKCVVVDGVKHEIDVFVSLDNGGGYQSIYIFECKNWEEPVGKNEIIIFIEKIRACRATKGWFVAQRFGSFAHAQSALEHRCELLTATEMTEYLGELFDCHFLFQNSMNTHALLGIKGESAQHTLKHFRELPAQISGRSYSTFDEFLRPLFKEMAERCLNSARTETFSVGS